MMPNYKDKDEALYNIKLQTHYINQVLILMNEKAGRECDVKKLIDNIRWAIQDIDMATFFLGTQE